jgi:hypothetical protein
MIAFRFAHFAELDPQQRIFRLDPQRAFNGSRRRGVLAGGGLRMRLAYERSRSRA